ncbi:MAG: hypothetical protein BWY32_03185 [bacterium ADurb.Bin243]|nr:MAG: hypothetical protein BWY32_03185 [bacterium ADurb.Bin243]
MKKFYSCLAVVLASLLLSFVPQGINNSCAQSKAEGAAANETAAGEEAFLATADIAMIYALHPAMQFYDQKVGLFIKPPKPGTTHDEFQTIIKNRQKDFIQGAEGNASEIKRLKGEIEILSKEINKLDSLKNDEMGAMNQRFELQLKSAASEEDRFKIQASKALEYNKIEAKFKTELETRNKKMAGLLDSFEKIQKSLLKIYYLSAEETSKKFDEINAEIKDAILKAAAKNKVSSVVNLNLLMPKQEKTIQPEKTIEEKTRFNSFVEDLLKSGPSYTKILGSLRTFETSVTPEVVKTRTPEINETEYLKMLQKLQKDQETEMASQNFYTRDFIMRLKPIKKLTANPIVYGGADLTREAVEIILEKNGVAKDKVKNICDAVFNN